MTTIMPTFLFEKIKCNFILITLLNYFGLAEIG